LKTRSLRGVKGRWVNKGGLGWKKKVKWNAGRREDEQGEKAQKQTTGKRGGGLRETFLTPGTQSHRD